MNPRMPSLRNPRRASPRDSRSLPRNQGGLQQGIQGFVQRTKKTFNPSKQGANKLLVIFHPFSLMPIEFIAMHYWSRPSQLLGQGLGSYGEGIHIFIGQGLLSSLVKALDPKVKAFLVPCSTFLRIVSMTSWMVLNLFHGYYPR